MKIEGTHECKGVDQEEKTNLCKGRKGNGRKIRRKESANVKRGPLSAGRVNVTSGVHCGMRKDCVARPSLRFVCEFAPVISEWSL